jgi:predicted amidohydrolase YtcJ
MVNRTAQNGKKIGPAEAITVEQALTAYTRGSAYACQVENTRGTITKGKLADFAVLADDPRTYDVAKINAIKILATIVAGDLVHNPANLTPHQRG